MNPNWLVSWCSHFPLCPCYERVAPVESPLPWTPRMIVFHHSLGPSRGRMTRPPPCITTCQTSPVLCQERTYIDVWQPEAERTCSHCSLVSFPSPVLSTLVNIFLIWTTPTSSSHHQESAIKTNLLTIFSFSFHKRKTHIVTLNWPVITKSNIIKIQTIFCLYKVICLFICRETDQLRWPSRGWDGGSHGYFIRERENHT